MATTITINQEVIKAGETAEVKFAFEPNTNYALSIGSDGQIQGLTSTGGSVLDVIDRGIIYGRRVYTALFTPNPNLDATECRLVYDVAGTDNDATSATFVVDTRAPTLAGTPTISHPNVTAASVITITFAFSERIAQDSFTTADLTIPAGMGTLTNLRTTDGGITWLVELRAPATLPANTDAKGLQIGINMAGITDIAGNPGTGNVNIVTYNIDNKPPSATITVTPNPVTTSNDRLVTVVITFDEAVIGFTAANIDFSNAHVTRYGPNPIGELNRSADGRTYTITYTAAPDTEDATNTISLRNLNTIRDASDNAATVSPTSNNYTIDTQDPYIASITFDKARLTAGETATITVTFNEVASGFTAAAFEIANGSVSNLTQDTTDGRIWRATFTPTANLARTSFTRLAVNLDGLTDRVGNVSSGTQVIDNPTPIVIDTKVFVVNDATVDGKQLVLQYSDETMLDPDQAHNAPNDAFVVLVGGVRNDVTGVVVDAAAKTVTLTLERAVSKGQQVTVAYNDPSTGNDQQAVQEAGTGKDAASFAAKPVTNLLTPAAPAAPAAGAPDSDRDGLSNNQEDLAPGLLRPDGSAGMEGDGNGDGVKDSQQIAVASNRDLTLVAGSRDGKLIPDSNARISELVRSDAPANLPKGMEMPIGLTAFKVGLTEGRSTESFSLYVDPALGATGYWVKNSAGTWVNLASEPYGGKVSSEGGRTRLDFQIEDGGQYDADGQVNGSISTPGAVAKMPLSIVGQSAPQVESHGFWF
ncbi:Ig-like domain-containing protein [Verminephrobacter eiseniae]|uniref:Ig-like domain-containing protein n=1 Tax=Verminephrobacter eiseniae TaxID=364317 RepID=UPI002238931C|nr:Ig-like domain-containing protein [Verminephrobacter eiseniae]MCW5236663.1 hypothetical protein [Verminephrobacter eiseniae]